MSTSMITAMAWIPRGAARERPVRFELSEEEYNRIKELAEKEKGVLDEKVEAKKSIYASDDEESGDDDENDKSALGPEFRMDEYDKEDNMNADEEGAVGEDFAMVETDGVALAMDADSEDEDADDDQIKPTDSLLVVALTEEDHSHLEVQLLSEDGSMYIHHDIALPDFPLCLAWTNCPPYLGSRNVDNDGNAEVDDVLAQKHVQVQNNLGSFVAVGTFQPAIEIWNLDVLDPIEPTAVLGGPLGEEEQERYEHEQKKQAKGKKGKKGQDQSGNPVGKDGTVYTPDSHTDAVMCLSWNAAYRQVLASGSADFSVKVWDMTTRACSHTFTHHSDKVQCVQWHPVEAWLLATGSFDGTVCLLDCRSAQVSATYPLPADIEAMAWDPHCPFLLYCACEDGQICVVDARVQGQILCSFAAHDKTCTALSFSVKVPGMLMTSSIDKTIRVWDTLALHAAPEDAAAAGGDAKEAKGKKGKDKDKKIKSKAKSALQPSLVAQKTMNAGKLFTMQMYADAPFVVASGGDRGAVAVWLSDEMESLREHFGSRVQAEEVEPLRAQAGSGSMGPNAVVRQDDDDDSEDEGGVAKNVMRTVEEMDALMHSSDDDDDSELEGMIEEMEAEAEGGEDGSEGSEEMDDPDDYEDSDDGWMDGDKEAPTPALVAASASKKKGKGKKGKK